MPEYNNNNRGGLWTNKDATSDKHPTFTGKVTIGVDILKELVELAKNKEEATVRIAAWSFPLNAKEKLATANLTFNRIKKQHQSHSQYRTMTFHFNRENKHTANKGEL